MLTLKPAPPSSMRYFFTISMLITGIICALLIVFFNYQIKKQVLAEIESEMSTQIELRHTIIRQEMDKARRDVRFLSSMPTISGIVRATENNDLDPKYKTPINIWYERLETIFKGFLENNPEAVQVRFIGKENNGQELIRVERKSGNIRIVAQKDMQQKANKTYFNAARELRNNEIYLSDISLNQEYGKVESPYWPTYRAAFAVRDNSNQFFGIVIVNFNARSIFNELKQNLKSHFNIFLLNTQGDFLLNPNPALEFGFDLGKRYTWQDQYSAGPLTVDNNQLKKVIATADQSVSYYVNRHLLLDNFVGGRQINIVLSISDEAIQQIINNRLTSAIVTIIIIYLVIVILLAFYQSNINKKMDLSQTRAKYAAIIDGSTDAIIALDKDNKIISWNNSAEEIFGYSKKFVQTRNIFDLLLPSPEASKLPKGIQAVFSGEKIPTFEETINVRNDKPITASVTLSPIHSNNNITGVAAIIRDITQRILIEERIIQLNSSLESQVETRTQELEIAKNDAVSANKAKSSFVANISHEIRTPMNGIFGMLKLLKQEPLSDKQQKYIKMAETSASNLTSLINDILDFSKIEAGKLEIEEIEFNIVNVLSELAVSMALKIQEKGIEFVFDVAEVEHQIVEGDFHRIQQVLINLIGNATKFTETGEIILSAKTKQISPELIQLTCSVTDTGIGITPERQSQLFTAFSQEDNSTTRKYGGTGLGLSITRQLCELMGGSISLHSVKDEGSTFSFEIKLKAVEKPKVDLFIQPKLNQTAFLLIDDNQASRNAITQLLTRWQAKVFAFPDFQTAIEQIKLEPDYEFILLDQYAIDDDKQNLIKTLFENQSIQDINSIVMTHQNKRLQKISALNQERLANIGKPVIPVELSGAIHQLLNIQQQQELPHELNRDNEVRINKTTKQTNQAFHNMSILIVDDNEINQAVAGGILDSWQLNISYANNGEDALNQLKQNNQTSPFELILMDCQMPLMDGYMATEQIRNGFAGKQYKNIPIIAMTASAMAGDREKCLNAGMNDYLTKPIIATELENKVELWLKVSQKNKR